MFLYPFLFEAVPALAANARLMGIYTVRSQGRRWWLFCRWLLAAEATTSIF